MDPDSYDYARWRQDYLTLSDLEARPDRTCHGLGLALGGMATFGWAVAILVEWLLLTAPWNRGQGIDLVAAEALVGVPIVNIVAQLALMLAFPVVALRSAAVPVASMLILVPWVGMVVLRFGLHLMSSGLLIAAGS